VPYIRLIACFFATIAVAFTFAACEEKAAPKDEKKEPAKKEAVQEPQPGTEAPPADPSPAAAVRMADLKVSAEGWEGDFNQMLSSWTIEKYTPNEEGFNDPNRVYVDAFDAENPADVEAYAAKLLEPNFQDFGYKYEEITRKEGVDGGWIIEGVVVDLNDPEDKELGFVVQREVEGGKIRCKSGTLVSAELRAEAIAMCQGLGY